MLSTMMRQAASSAVTLHTYDALAARARIQLGHFTDWLTSNGVQGYIGEYGWPQTSPGSTDQGYDARWDIVADQWLKAASSAGLHATAWCTSDWGIDLKAYRVPDGSSSGLSIITSVGAEIENYPSTVNYLRGVNISGAEFSGNGNGAQYIGTLGTNYTYPNSNDYGFLAGRGVKLIRFAFRWERLQPTLKGALDTAELNRIKAVLSGAAAAGLVVLLDAHNYGRYDTQAAINSSYSTAGVYDITQNAPSQIGGTMGDCFNDFWQRVAVALGGSAGLWGYGLTNEPHDLAGGVGGWQLVSAAAVEAIRAVDTTGYISVSGYSWGSASAWPSVNGSSPWLTATIPSGQPGAGLRRSHDPHLVFEAHHYWNTDASGSYDDSYDNQLVNAQNEGYSAYRA